MKELTQPSSPWRDCAYQLNSKVTEVTVHTPSELPSLLEEDGLLKALL